MSRVFSGRRRDKRKPRPAVNYRRLLCEPLEERRLLSLGPDDSAGAGAVELFGVSPALFVENQGQWPDPAVRYAFQGSGANVLFTDTGPVFQVLRRDVAEQTDQPDGVRHRADPLANLAEHEETATRSAQFSVTFEGGNLVEPVGLDRAETVYNYYVGDQSRWRSEVPTYETVAYVGLYEGIDPDLAWATYLGGSASDAGLGIAVDSAGNALVTGRTWSSDFAGADNSHHSGDEDAFWLGETHRKEPSDATTGPDITVGAP